MKSTVKKFLFWVSIAIIGTVVGGLILSAVLNFGNDVQDDSEQPTVEDNEQPTVEDNEQPTVEIPEVIPSGKNSDDLTLEIEPEHEISEKNTPEQNKEETQQPDLKLHNFYNSNDSTLLIQASESYLYHSKIENLNKDYPVSKVCVELKIFNIKLGKYVNITKPDSKVRIASDIEPRSIPADKPITCAKLDEKTSTYPIMHLIKLDIPGEYFSYRTITYYDDILKINITQESVKTDLTVR